MTTLNELNDKIGRINRFFKTIHSKLQIKDLEICLNEIEEIINKFK